MFYNQLSFGRPSFHLRNRGDEIGHGAFFIRGSLSLWKARGEGGGPKQGSSDQLGSGSVKNVSCFSYSLPRPDSGAVRSGCGSRAGTRKSQVVVQPTSPGLRSSSTHHQECTCLLALAGIIGLLCPLMTITFYFGFRQQNAVKDLH